MPGLRLTVLWQIALDIAYGVITGHRGRGVTERVCCSGTVCVYVQGECVCMLVNWIGCVLHACLLHKQTVCFEVPVKQTLSCLCCSPTNSGSGGSPASRRPNEKGVGLGVQWGKKGGWEEINR